MPSDCLLWLTTPFFTPSVPNLDRVDTYPGFFGLFPRPIGHAISFSAKQGTARYSHVLIKGHIWLNLTRACLLVRSSA